MASAEREVAAYGVTTDADRLSPAPIIVGAPRSGTTLLRLMLDAHPDLAIPPETGFLSLASEFGRESDVDRFFSTLTQYPPEAPAWQDFGVDAGTFRNALRRIEPFTAAEGYRAFYRLYASRFGKPRWGDKTPRHAFHIEAIATLLPEAHIVHLIRDGRDACLSLRKQWFSPGDDIAVQARHWASFVTAARKQAAGCPRYLEIKYEELILHSEKVMRRICDFLKLTYDPIMLEYHLQARSRLAEHMERHRRDGTLLVSRNKRLAQQESTCHPPDRSKVFLWKSTMPQSEQIQFVRTAGALLCELGYDVECR